MPFGSKLTVEVTSRTLSVHPSISDEQMAPLAERPVFQLRVFAPSSPLVYVPDDRGDDWKDTPSELG